MTEQEVLIDIRERLVRVETLLVNYNGMRDKVNEVEARSKSNTHRLNDIESNQNWLWRTIAGALILGAIGASVRFF